MGFLWHSLKMCFIVWVAQSRHAEHLGCCGGKDGKPDKLLILSDWCGKAETRWAERSLLEWPVLPCPGMLWSSLEGWSLPGWPFKEWLKLLCPDLGPFSCCPSMSSCSLMRGVSLGVNPSQDGVRGWNYHARAHCWSAPSSLQQGGTSSWQIWNI